jgi:hypothetical protein
VPRALEQSIVREHDVGLRGKSGLLLPEEHDADGDQQERDDQRGLSRSIARCREVSEEQSTVHDAQL